MMLTLLILFWLSIGLCVYTHVGYPVLMMFCGRKRPLPDLADAKWPAVSLIIPAHNEEAVLRAKLENSLAIDYPAEKLQILVASDGSVDATVDIASEFVSRGVTLLPFFERRGKASAVNDAVAQATGEVLCLCDANVMFLPDALRRMVARLMESPQNGAVTGDVQLRSEESDFGEGEKTYYQIERSFQVGESRVGSMIGVDGGMYVIRKPLFPRLPPDTILDDFVVAMRVIQQGYRVVYEPTAIATENGTPTSQQEFRRRVRVAAGAVQSMRRGDFPPWMRPITFWQYVSHKPLRWFGPIILPVLLVSNALLWPAGVFYQGVFLGQMGCYLLALLGWMSLPFRATKLGGVPFYFVMSHVAMALGLYRGLRNQQRVTWNRTERSVTAAT